MLKSLWWAVTGWLNNWRFYRSMRMAPVKKLGELYVKEVGGNLYAVEGPEDITPAMPCQCHYCVTGKVD